jgi:signal transduction histidine kinase
MKHILSILFLAVIFFLPGIISASPDSRPTKRVLVLYSLERENVGQSRVNEQLRELFGRDTTFHIEMYSEYLDLNRFPVLENTSTLNNYLRRKYSRLKPDLVITILPPALDSLEVTGNQFFKEIPVIAACIPRDRAQSLELSPLHNKIQGIIYADNAYEIAQSALRLRPGTKHIAFIAGTSVLDLSFKAPILREIKRATEGTELIDLSGLSIGETLSRVRSLPPNTIVFITSIFRDKEGVSFSAPDALRLVSNASNAPVFGFVESHVGKGIVGGRLASLEWQVAKIVELTHRILSGESPATIPIVDEQGYHMVYDWVELKRWGIPESRLPKGSIIINREITLFDRYKKYLVAALVFFAVQTFLIAFLIYVVRAQKKTARQLTEYQERYRELLRIDRSSRLGELTASLAHELNQPLAAILSTAQAALRFLETGENDPALHREILQNIVKDDKRAADVIRSLRSMVKKGSVQREKINIFEVLFEVIAIVQGELIAHSIQIETLLYEVEPWVFADKNQIQQVLLNLLLNGIDAIDQTSSDRKMLVIKTEKSDGLIRISVHNTGPAIPEENLEKIFEPFYTTKNNGFGMGLAVCKTIINEHKGRIWAANDPDGGATFTFELKTVDND